MNETDVAADPIQLREALQRKITRGTQLVNTEDLTAEQLETWARSIARLSERLSDLLGDPVRHRVRQVLDRPSVALDTKAIEILRIEFGYGYRELARRADMSLPTVTRTIDGKSQPGPGVAKGLADVWHLGVLELFDFDDETDKLTPRTVESLIEVMDERDLEEGSAAWIRANPEPSP